MFLQLIQSCIDGIESLGAKPAAPEPPSRQERGGTLENHKDAARKSLHWLRLGHTPKGEEGLVVIDLLQVAKIKKPRTLLQPYIGVGRAFRLPLPPNRTGGFPAYGSPVSGLTCKRIDHASTGPRRHMALSCQRISFPLTPASGAVNSRRVQRVSLCTQATVACCCPDVVSSCEHWPPFVLAVARSLRLHLPALPSLHARYGASSLLWTLCLPATSVLREKPSMNAESFFAGSP